MTLGNSVSSLSAGNFLHNHTKSTDTAVSGMGKVCGGMFHLTLPVFIQDHLKVRALCMNVNVESYHWVLDTLITA